MEGVNAVLATVVDLDGSSYRSPGVRMLLLENGKMIGAVSGGCVEKEVYAQSLEVFRTGKPKMMTYDGRYRLGCEGVLYILLEPFQPERDLINSFYECLKSRSFFEMTSVYSREIGHTNGIGTTIEFESGASFRIGNSDEETSNEALPVFRQEMAPRFKLVIVGAEHDAVQLCLMASLNGWEVDVVTSFKDPKTKADFPGAEKVVAVAADEITSLGIDAQTAVVLMTHNYAKDLNFLLALSGIELVYLGLLGPAKRRDKLLSDLMDHSADMGVDFFEKTHGPAGLNLGAETPQEIAVSIVAEILAFVRKQNPIPLTDKLGGIHDRQEKVPTS